MNNRKIISMRLREEQKLIDEINKIKGAEQSYGNYTFFNSLSITFFIMGIIVIITASIYKSMFMNINESLVSLVALIFIMSSILSLMVSEFYDLKTVKLIKRHFNNEC